MRKGKKSRRELVNENRRDDLELAAIAQLSRSGTKIGEELAAEMARGLARRKGYLRE